MEGDDVENVRDGAESQCNSERDVVFSAVALSAQLPAPHVSIFELARAAEHTGRDAIGGAVVPLRARDADVQNICATRELVEARVH